VAGGPDRAVDHPCARGGQCWGQKNGGRLHACDPSVGCGSVANAGMVVMYTKSEHRGAAIGCPIGHAPWHARGPTPRPSRCPRCGRVLPEVASGDHPKTSRPRRDRCASR
jgi:hypothetical protein